MIGYLVYFVILIVSVVLHELAHGYSALALGDTTAKRLGRLTLNPIKHMDPLGSVILPALSIISGFPVMLAWAKPVPVQPDRFKSPLFGMMIVALCGPLMNLFLALLCFVGLQFTELQAFSLFLKLGCMLNIWLAIFNLCPIPPLDGSRVLMYFLPPQFKLSYMQIERYGFVIIFILAYLGFFEKISKMTLSPLLSFLGL